MMIKVCHITPHKARRRYKSPEKVRRRRVDNQPPRGLNYNFKKTGKAGS